MPKKSKKNKVRNLKGLGGSSAEPPQTEDLDRLLDENTKAIGESFHIEDNQRAGLPSPRLPFTEAVEQHKPGETSSPKGKSFKKRIRALTGSAKAPAALDKENWESNPLSIKSAGVLRSSFGDSSATQDTTFPLSSPTSTVIQPPKGKKRSGRKVSNPGVLRNISSPHFYTMVDLDYCEAQAAMNIGTDEPDPEIGKSSFEELLAYLRRVTGTEVRAIDVNDSKVPRRPNESRAWDHKNLRCVECRKACPICKANCCVREDIVQKAADESQSSEEVDKAKRLLKIIDFLGVNAKDVSTYVQCTPPDGCGRYVCPDCSGVCPNEICRDIQCKECKPNVWDPCDWHD